MSAAERNQGTGVAGDVDVLGIVDDGLGMGKLTPDLEEARELDRGDLADGAPEQGTFGHRVETAPAVHDVGGELLGPRTRKRLSPGLRGRTGATVRGAWR